GDTVFVPVIGPVTAVAGNVRRSGIFELKPNAHPDLSDVLEMAGGVMPTTYINRVQIQRVIAHEKQTVIDKQFNFAEANPRFYIDIKDMDLIKFYPINSPADNVVYLEGAVKYPGPCQWKQGMTVKDLIASSSDLQIGAYVPRAEIVRTDPQTLALKIIDVELGKLLAGDAGQNLALQPGDHLVIASELKLTQRVTLEGELRLPGTYTITKGERLSSVIKRAGGYTDTAYLYGAVLKRKSAKDAQFMSYKELINKMETELILKERETSGPGLTSEDLAIKTQENERNKELINKLKDTTVIEGRVIISLRDPDVMAGTKDDIALETGDTLFIPKIPNVVNVLGEVYSPSSVVFVTNKPASYYLNLVGGTTDQANTGDIYLLRADGSIVSRRQGRNVITTALLPGDTVLVPKSFDRFDFWLALKDGTHWFYEATLAFAVIATYVRK
ncbi:MAG: SLBB domain-containing protein, partial [Candidatus Margulisiibacteriota bacterium]